MDALANEMEAFGLPLVVEELEFKNPLEEKLVSEFKLLGRDPALVDDADTNDQLAVVPIVHRRKYPVEQAGSQAVEVEEELPGLVATRELFGRVARCAVKGAREIGSSVRNGLAMLLPDVSFQHSPAPITIWVSLPAGFAVAPQVEHEGRKVDNRLMHDVPGEASRQIEDASKAIKKAGLPDPGLEASFLVSVFVRGLQNILEIFSIFC